MAVVYAGPVRTALKEIVRRTDGAVTRAGLIESATLELGIDQERVVEQLEISSTSRGRVRSARRRHCLTDSDHTLFMTALPEILTPTAIDLFATADQWGVFVTPVVALGLLLVVQRYLGRWPDLWRARRAVLPYVARLGADAYPTVNELDDVDLEEVVPEKTALSL